MTIKIVGRSKGKSIIAASAYLNGDVMKDYETGRTSYYTSKNEVVYTRLMMCENAPPEWAVVPEENIARFQKSLRYKRSVNKEVELEKFKVTFQKQKLWNEVLKVEKGSDAQLGRSFEFSLPKEWNRQEQIDFTTNFIQRNFVNKGMCADWSIHDKGDGNPHVHLLLTMRPFKKEHSWGNKEVKDWAFERDSSGQIIITASAVLHWVLLIGMIVILVVGIIAVVWFTVKWIYSIYKKYCWDGISVMVAIMSAAMVISFGDWMKQFLSINQVVLLILLQGIYTIIRWYVQGCMENRGY